MVGEMLEKDSIERFREGLKKAASCARELGMRKKSKHWLEIGKGLEGVLQNGTKMFNGRALTRKQVLDMTDSYVDKKKDTVQ